MDVTSGEEVRERAGEKYQRQWLGFWIYKTHPAVGAQGRQRQSSEQHPGVLLPEGAQSGVDPLPRAPCLQRAGELHGASRGAAPTPQRLWDRREREGGSPSWGSAHAHVPNAGKRGGLLKEGRFRLGRGEKFFPMRVLRPWPRLPRGAVAAPSLAVSKARLDGAWSTLGWGKGVPARGRGVELGDL